MSESPIKTYGQLTYVQSYDPATDRVIYIGWITDKTLTTGIPAGWFTGEGPNDVTRMRAESLSLARMESYLRGDQYPTLRSLGLDQEAEPFKGGIWSDENTEFLKGLSREPEAHL